MRQKRLERFWTAEGGSRRDEPHGWGEQSSSPPGGQDGLLSPHRPH
jgi:hypothetical protein